MAQGDLWDFWDWWSNLRWHWKPRSLKIRKRKLRMQQLQNVKGEKSLAWILIRHTGTWLFLPVNRALVTQGTWPWSGWWSFTFWAFLIGWQDERVMKKEDRMRLALKNKDEGNVPFLHVRWILFARAFSKTQQLCTWPPDWGHVQSAKIWWCSLVATRNGVQYSWLVAGSKNEALCTYFWYDIHGARWPQVCSYKITTHWEICLTMWSGYQECNLVFQLVTGLALHPRRSEDTRKLLSMLLWEMWKIKSWYDELLGSLGSLIFSYSWTFAEVYIAWTPLVWMTCQHWSFKLPLDKEALSYDSIAVACSSLRLHDQRWLAIWHLRKLKRLKRSRWMGAAVQPAVFCAQMLVMTVRVPCRCPATWTAHSVACLWWYSDTFVMTSQELLMSAQWWSWGYIKAGEAATQSGGKNAAEPFYKKAIWVMLEQLRKT